MAVVARDDLGFNLTTAKKYADAYSDSVSVGCIIIDEHGNTLYNTGCSRKPEYMNDCHDDSPCGNSCKQAQNILGNQLSCSNVHLYGSYQAERFGGSYIFFCPLGLVHWASPITINSIMKGAYVAGPVHMVDPDDFLIDDIIGRFNICNEDYKKLRRFIDKIPIVQPDKVNKLAEMLFVMAAYISDANASKYIEEREYLEQQSDISEYIYYIKTMGGSEEKDFNYPLEKERELLYHISIGDKAASKRLLNEILGYVFFSTGGNFEIIKARILELIVLLSRAAVEGGADVETIFGLNYKYLNQVHNFKTIEELTFWISKIMSRFTDCVFNLTDVKHVDVIYKSIDFIKRNLMKKITLDDVAKNVYLSPSYFSKIFKKEMKVSFNTYLNQVRIETSKKLMEDNSLSLVDIANLVGYEDQSYFTKVFKKLTGVSPGRYRESRGKII